MMASLPRNVFAPLATVLQRSASEGGYRLQCVGLRKDMCGRTLRTRRSTGRKNVGESRRSPYTRIVLR
jgi:hypothetical protein